MNRLFSCTTFVVVSALIVLSLFVPPRCYPFPAELRRTRIVSDQTQDEVYIHIRSDQQQETANRIRDKLMHNGYRYSSRTMVATTFIRSISSVDCTERRNWPELALGQRQKRTATFDCASIKNKDDDNEPNGRSDNSPAPAVRPESKGPEDEHNEDKQNRLVPSSFVVSRSNPCATANERILADAEEPYHKLSHEKTTVFLGTCVDGSHCGRLSRRRFRITLLFSQIR